MSYSRKEIIDDAMVFTAPVGTEWPERWEYPSSIWEYVGDVSKVSLGWDSSAKPKLVLHGFQSEHRVAVFMAGWRPGIEQKRAYYIWELDRNLPVQHPEHPGKEYGMIIDRRPE